LNPFHAAFLLAFKPRRFVREAVLQDRKPPTTFTRKLRRAHGTRMLRNALGVGALLVLASAIAGSLVGAILSVAFGAPTARVVALLQAVAGGVLLWATISYLGWEIQSYKGLTLVEQVNRWIFRLFYCLGTSLLVVSLVWPL
jgi:hypothetical protein